MSGGAAELREQRQRRRGLADAQSGRRRPPFLGHYLIIHRIKPWLIERCAFDAGPYCTQY